jgi:CheY-like chemotaxis protein
MLNKKIIAVIDDDDLNHTILSGLLSDHYQIISFKSSNYFFEYYQNNLPDLILLDIVMPDIDGYETIIKIKQLHPDMSTPIIFLTSKEIDSSCISFHIFYHYF